MRYRKLGRTGIEISEVGYGAWGIGGKQWKGGTDDESVRALHRAFEHRRSTLTLPVLLHFDGAPYRVHLQVKPAGVDGDAVDVEQGTEREKGERLVLRVRRDELRHERKKEDRDLGIERVREEATTENSPELLSCWR